MAQVNVYKLGVSATTPAANMTSVSLPRKGTIKQIAMVASCSIETDTVGKVQVALNRPNAQFASAINTPCNVLAELHIVALLTTSGISNATNSIVVPCNQPVVEKDVLYLNGVATSGGVNGLEADVLIFVEET